MVASPKVGSKSPVSIETVVVLPAPLWPSTQKISPSGMVAEKSLRAFREASAADTTREVVGSYLSARTSLRDLTKGHFW